MQLKLQTTAGDDAKVEGTTVRRSPSDELVTAAPLYTHLHWVETDPGGRSTTPPLRRLQRVHRFSYLDCDVAVLYTVFPQKKQSSPIIGQFTNFMLFDIIALEYIGNYSATSNNMKLGHWSLMGGLLQLVQRGGDWAGPQPAHAPPRCTKCNSPPINGRCTNHRTTV